MKIIMIKRQTSWVTSKIQEVKAKTVYRSLNTQSLLKLPSTIAV